MCRCIYTSGITAGAFLIDSYCGQRLVDEVTLVKQEPVRMKRKVQQLGSSTLAVTVPADWARTHDVTKGDEITIQRDNNGGSLVLVPQQPAVRDTEATVDADRFAGKALERALITQYVLGRQLITIEGTTTLGLEHRDGVLAAERQLMGLSPVEQGGRYIKVRCSVAADDFDLPTLLDRLGRTAASMRQGALRGLIEDDTNVARKIISRRQQVEKLFYLFRRLLFATHRNPRLSQVIGVDTGFPLIGYRALVQKIFTMADTAHAIGTIVRDHDGEIPSEATADRLQALGSDLDEAISEVRAAVLDPSHEATETARDAFARVDDDIESFHEYLLTERPMPLLVLQRIVDHLEQSARQGRDMLSIATNLALRQETEIVSNA